MNTYKIDAKCARRVFCPANAIEDAFYKRSPNEEFRLITRDGKMAKATFLGTWNNSGDRYEKLFDEFCRDNYNMPFHALRSIWLTRLSSLDYYWHLIELNEE